MSVSLTLLPVAIAMRVVMGKENFEKWIEAQQDRVATDITSEADLVRCLKLAGYDAEKYGTMIKTHIEGEESYFFWECIDGKWVAIFSKYLDDSLKEAFMEKMEDAAQRAIFLQTDSDGQNLSKTFPTNFADEGLLCQALSDLGGDLKVMADGSIVCRVDSARLIFTRNGDNPYDVEVRGASNIEHAYQFLSNMDDVYCQSVQTSVYQRVKSEAEQKNWQISSEETLPDKSILLTIQVD